MSKKYQDYYKNHIGYNSVSREAYLLKYYQDNFGVLLLDKFDIKNIRVLEIGCGKGTFAKYCASIGVGEYYGFDLDEQAISDNKKTFQENNTYIFSSENVAKFMRDHKNDIIFMSHVLEHLDESDASIYIQARVFPSGRYLLT